MKELLREPDPVRMGLLRSILESRGIATVVRHEREFDVIGSSRFDLPKYWPALSVLREEDHDAAVAILRDVSTADEIGSRTEVTCPACGELNPGNFEVCWSCGAGIGG